VQGAGGGAAELAQALRAAVLQGLVERGATARASLQSRGEEARVRCEWEWSTMMGVHRRLIHRIYDIW
jgi:hypothetical protein